MCFLCLGTCFSPVFFHFGTRRSECAPAVVKYVCVYYVCVQYVCVQYVCVQSACTVSVGVQGVCVRPYGGRLPKRSLKNRICKFILTAASVERA